MLSQEILDHYNLRKDPFDSVLASADEILMTPQHKRAYNKLVDAAAKQGFVALWGQVGSGKTELTKLLAIRLREKTDYIVSEPMIIEKEKARPTSIMQAMIYDFLMQMHPDSGNMDINTVETTMRQSRRNTVANANLEQLSRYVYATLEHKIKQGKKCVLILEEGHRYSDATLKSLKVFHEFQRGYSRMLAIIVVGQNELYHRFKTNFNIREVAQRINLVKLEQIPNMIRQYTEHRVKFAGGDASMIFEPAAYTAAKNLLRDMANPLTIINLMSEAVSLAWDKGEKKVGAEIIEIAFTELSRVKMGRRS